MSRTEAKLGLVDFLKVVLNDYSLPVVLKKYEWDDRNRYIYPSSTFEELEHRHEVHFLGITHKIERRKLLKELMDFFIKEKPPIHLVHLGLYAIYRNPYRYNCEDFTESVLGKRRLEVLDSLPKFETVTNDEYIMESWSSLTRVFGEDAFKTIFNPSFKDVRLMFKASLFEQYTGVGYDGDWVEPKPGARERECSTITEEKNPMSQGQDNDYIEGPIMLGTDGGGRRHFVNHHPIHAGTLVEVKFGDGWITGRYEYDFAGSNITIHSKNDSFSIKDGHIIRVKK